MNKRLSQRGRYPIVKGPGIEQMTSTNSQFPQTTTTPYATTSEMNFYSAPPQSQTGQNIWTQHYPNSSSTYQQNQGSHQPMPAPSGYWSGEQYPIQPPSNEAWNWKADNSIENSSYTNYQQPPVHTSEQWQQIPYSQVDNQNYSMQQPVSYVPPSQQGYISSVESQSTNNNSNIAPLNTTLPTWENGSINITQPEQLPWTYSAPQYCNPPHSVSEFPQNSNAITTNIPSWTYSSDYVATSEICVQDSSSGNYLAVENVNTVKNLESDTQTSISTLEQNVICESDISDKNIVSTSANISTHCDITSNSSKQIEDPEYGGSTLSAFFQNSEQENSAHNSEQEGSVTPDVKTTLDSSSLEETMPHLQINESEKSSVQSEEENDLEGATEDDDDVNQENNFIQKENLSCLTDDVDQKSNFVSSIGFVEEPINQEVPEPHMNELGNMKLLQKQDYSAMSSEEPLNQQIPVESGEKSRSTSSERERIVIRPREESPFKPPRLANNSKGSVVQQEIAIQSLVESKQTEGKTVVQEVNLETFPDNLERPPDYEELRKQSPLYVSHQKHLRNELNSSPSSLLCDNPDIPCVTLAPAAPPLHSSSKSDKSESSSDSKQESFSFETSSILSSLKESVVNSPVALNETELSENAKKISHSSLVNNGQISTEKILKSNRKHDNVVLPVSKEEMLNIEQRDQQVNSLYLKDTKIKEVRTSDHLQKVAPNNDHLQIFNSNPQANNSRRNLDYNSPVNKPRTEPRYSNSPHEQSRQRFAEHKYPTFDERHYYSDRERSRPPSRSSLGERPEDYMYQGKQGDYIYPPNGERRHVPPEYARPSSRVSESDVNYPDRHSQYDYYRQQYPYTGPYPRGADYYQRPPNYRGYDYDPYQRDPYYASYYDAYRYAYSNYNYGFYDELYRNDPRYRQYREEQYRQYYAKYGYDVDYERSSVHSGRSSANELAKDTAPSNQYPEPDDSNDSEFSSYNLRQDYTYEDPNDSSVLAIDQSSTPSARLTPVKFSYAHPIARFSPGGMFITVIPCHVTTVLAAPVRIESLQIIMENEESFEELKNYQGPLIRGLTHKNDVIEFCSQKIKCLKLKSDIVDRDSYVLLWELMVLLLRQNGSVAGSDIAELLLKDHEVLRPHVVPLRHAIETPQGEHSPADVNDSSSQSHAGDTSSPDEGIVVLNDKSSLNMPKTVDVDKITCKFREFLLFGHKKDALEWAMKHGLWGHALFLASKMDLRTYANVMTRFANSLALNDPLQTLYQLMSGRQPSAVTGVADKKWGDWRPHLAMILSNPSAHPDVDSRSITTLGDTLASRGCLPAAHFCYIMAQVEFGTFEQKNSKLVLLSTDHNLSFEEFATNEAIQCTEIYEYAQSLANPGYMLPHLQLYKFIYALRLVEHGFLEEALHYCEVISGNLQTHPNLFTICFISEVFKLASQLKYYDPHFLRGQGELEDQDDPEWLRSLSILVQNYSSILLGETSQPHFEQQSEPIQNLISEQASDPSFENKSFQNVPGSGAQNEMCNTVNQLNYYQSNNWKQQSSMMQNTTSLPNSQQDNMTHYQSDLASNQGSFHMESSIPSHEENETTDVPSSPVTQTPPFDYYSGGTQQVQESRHSSYDQTSFSSSLTCRERRDSALSTASRYSTSSLSVVNKNSVKDAQKSEGKKESKHNSQAGKTWLGGIFSRLLPKAPNQMILPDDKNPTIVWDDVKNCWVNKDSNDDDESSAPLAPPTDMELMGSKSSDLSFLPPISPMPPTSTTSPINKFQRPKTRVMRQNYVDVLNTSGATLKTNVPPEALFPSTFEHTASPKMFIPSSAPVSGENSAEFEPVPTSFSTSTEEPSQMQSAPLMLDPAEFDSRKSSVSSQRHTLGRTGRRTYPT